MKNKIKMESQTVLLGGLAFLCGGGSRNLLEQLEGLLESWGRVLENESA